MDLATLQDQAARLTLPRFTEDTALKLGLLIVEMARGENLPVVINIRTPDRCLFHAAMPGSTGLNDRWAQRKSATALLFHDASLRVGLQHRAKGESLAHHGLSETEFADHGGAVPIRVRGVGVVAVVTVSGLPEVEDHALVVRGLEALLALG